MTVTQSGAREPEPLPRRFGHYHLFDRIGRGGMADIYLARAATGLGPARRVVVKEILRPLCADERFAKMLIDEAKLVAGLRHANVVQVHDLGREDERLFIAMEYVEGFDLHQLLRQVSKRRVGFPAEFAIFIVRETLAALDYAHRARGEDGAALRIVHRDVSPSNVLISFEGEVKLCDFGIAKALGSPFVSGSEDPSGDATGERSKIAGKAAYMSPEHARGEDLDARADLFSAGILLWELCAGRRLYRGSEERMLELAREGAVPPLPERGLPESRRLQTLLDRALCFDREARFEDAEEMLRALDAYASAAKLHASQLRLGAFLTEHFESEVVRVRRHRERAAEALDLGPPVQIEPIADPEVEEESPKASRPSKSSSKPTKDVAFEEDALASQLEGQTGAFPMMLGFFLVVAVLIALAIFLGR